MKQSLLSLFTLLLVGMVGITNAQTTLYTSDFTATGGFEHSSANPPAAGPQLVDLGNYSLGYDTAPTTDGSLNFFRSNGTVIESRDFGGAAYFVSDPIDISTVAEFSISGSGVTAGGGFNAGGEFFQWSYSLNGGAFVLGPSISGTGSLNTPSAFSNVPTGGATSLIVRFDFNMNGGSDGFDISSLEVTGISAAAGTQVNFASSSAVVNEGDGTVIITVSITNEDSSNPTTADVVLSMGDPNDINNYITQTVTFPAGSSANQSVTVTLTDDSEIEDTEDVLFSLEDVVGGDMASLGTSTTFTLTIEDNDFPPAPTLIITEIADPGDNASARFVEVYNNGSQPIDFDITPVYLARFANANTTSVDEQLIGVLGAGEYLVIAGSGTNYESAYGFSPDAISTGVSGNGDDTYALFSGQAGSGTLFDIYGAIGTDGTGEPWEYEDSRAVRNDLNVMPKTTWTASEWDIITANVNDMSPKRGEPNYVYAAGSWSPAAPEGLSTTNDEIRVRDNVTLTGDLEFGSLTVDENITITVGANSITSSRNLFVNGTLDGQDGTLNFAGILPQSTFGMGTLTIEDLIINNAGGVAFNNITNLEGTLSLTNGELATNDLLTLKSSEGKAAVINEVVSGSIVGNVTVEQFFPATTGRAFRFVSAPVNFDGSITANWQEGGSNAASFGVQITGGDVADGYDPSATNNPSLFRYDNGYTDPASAWIPLSTANSDDLTSISPEAGDAYRLFIRGDRTTDLTSNTPVATATTLRATGTLVTGAYPATPIALAGSNLYSLIGNPYQSKVDVEQLLQNATNVIATEYWQWDPTTNNYVLYEFATPTTPMGSDISKNALPGQSFFVQSDATGNGSLQFQESYKTAGSDVATKNVNVSHALTINLSTQEQIETGTANDIAIARFGDPFNTNFDPQDTQKFFGLSHSLAWEKNGAYYAVNRTAVPQDGDRFNLSVFVGTSGTYYFTIQSPELEGLATYFYDGLSDTYDLVTPNNPVVISKSIDRSNSSSTAGDRFQIVFRKSTLGMDDNFAFAKAISLFPNPSSNDAVSISNLEAGKPVTFKIFNTLGQQVLTVEKTISGTIETINGLDNLANGLYLVNVYQNDLQTSIKLILN